MKILSFDEFILNSGISVPSFDEFKKLGDMTALFEREKNDFIQLNYERGPLLYAIISMLKPKNILEIGRARGYSTLSMAWALSDNNPSGRIFTIDPISIEKSSKLLLDDHTTQGSRYENSSIQKIWSKIAKKDWIEKIIPLTGFSGEIMQKTSFPEINFAYIDGAHFYSAVKHDFYSVLNNVGEDFGILLDDYADRPQYGIKQLVDEQIDKHFDTSLIQTDRQNHLKNMLSLKDQNYGMVYFHSNSLKMPLKEIYTHNERTKAIMDYLKFEDRQRRRTLINDKVPFLKNIKFRFLE